MDNLDLLYGKDINICEDVYFRHPKLSDVAEIGRDKYSKYLSIMISSILDVADILWCEQGIWYEDIKNEWNFFIQKALSDNKKISVKIKTEDDKLLKVEEDCLSISDDYRDALNFFFKKDGDYIISSFGTNKEHLVMYNVQKEYIKEKETGYYIIKNNCFKITEHIYEVSTKILKEIVYHNPEYMFLKGHNKSTKKYMLKNDYRLRKKNKKEFITLDSVVSALIARGARYCDVWNYPIYTIYNQYYRLNKIDQYKETVSALYNGCIDTKKNPVNWEKIDWSSIIN